MPEGLVHDAVVADHRKTSTFGGGFHGSRCVASAENRVRCGQDPGRRVYRRELLATRDELVRSQHDNARNVEAGKWRVRLEDALRTRPDVAEGLRELTLSARSRLATS